MLSGTTDWLDDANQQKCCSTVSVSPLSQATLWSHWNPQWTWTSPTKSTSPLKFLNCVFCTLGSSSEVHTESTQCALNLTTWKSRRVQTLLSRRFMISIDSHRFHNSHWPGQFDCRRSLKRWSSYKKSTELVPAIHCIIWIICNIMIVFSSVI